MRASLERLMAMGTIPGAEDVSDEVLHAVSTLISRETDFDVVMPDQCRNVVAFLRAVEREEMREAEAGSYDIQLENGAQMN